MKRKALILSLVFGTLLSSCTFGSSEDITLNIIEINDLHGYAYKSSSDDNINLANVAAYIDDIRGKEKYDNVLLIANGDMFQGTAYSNLSYGKSVIEAMNTMNFDMMGIGNHEFDWTLDAVLKYWDANKDNGEANFPLINGNVRDSAENNRLVGETNTSDNILPYTIVNKGGVKVGLLSYIGDQTSSICQNKFGTYYIDCYGNEDINFIKEVRTQALKVKKEGADIIVLNFHEGSMEGIKRLSYNLDFASMKDEDGNYLIDAVLNGHTHSVQSGVISRTNGVDLPIVQGGSYCNNLGLIDLKIDGRTKKVKSCSASNRKTSLSRRKKEDISKLLENTYDLIKDDIIGKLAEATSTSTRENLGLWTTNIMRQYSGADITFINQGGIRSNAKLTNGSKVTLEALYEINPFDNSLVYSYALGKEIKNYYQKNESYNYWSFEGNISSFEDDKLYKMLTIDYVFYGSTFLKQFFTKIEKSYVSNECARDLMLKDLKARENGLIDFNSSEVYIQKGEWPN